MIIKRKNKAGKIRYGVRVDRGPKQVWVGTYETLGEARVAERRAKGGTRTSRMTCDAYVKHYLAAYRERRKKSSYDTASYALKKFAEDFAGVPMDQVEEIAAQEWALDNRYRVPMVVALFNAAKKAKLVDNNPWDGLSQRSQGRKHLHPLTVAEVDQLAQAALETQGPIMQALVYFLAYTGMRVGEVYALEWTDIDFEAMRIRVERRSYKGTIDLPKSNMVRTIVLTPQARDAIADIPRTSRLIFTAKRGGMFSQSQMTWYWGKVTTRFGKEITPHELRHFAAHHLHATLNLPARVVAVQLGHNDGGRQVEQLYGHGDVGALSEIDRAFNNVIPLRRASSE